MNGLITNDVNAKFDADFEGAGNAFRAWRKRHGRAVRKFHAVPTRCGGGWRIVAQVPRPSIVETPATAELAALRRDYTLPYIAPQEEYARAKAARDARRVEGYDMAADPITVAEGWAIIQRQEAALKRARS